MNCSKCGEILEHGAKFCPSCGASVAESTAATDNTYAQNVSSNGYVSAANVPPYTPYTPAPMSTGGWVGRTILLGILGAIPLVGWIVYLVILFTWRGDQNKDTTFRNWATAQLIMTLIGVVIVVVLLVLLVIYGVLTSQRYY